MSLRPLFLSTPTHHSPLSLPLYSLAPVGDDLRRPAAATSPTTAASTAPSPIRRLPQGPPTATATTTIADAAYDAIAVRFVQKHGRPARFPPPISCPAASAAPPLGLRLA